MSPTGLLLKELLEVYLCQDNQSTPRCGIERILGSILDRIDIYVEVPSVNYEKLSGDRLGETSKSICSRVQAERDIHAKRFFNHVSDIISNADMRVGEIRKFCKFRDDGQSLMRAARNDFNFLIGNWTTRHLMLMERLKGCAE